MPLTFRTVLLIVAVILFALSAIGVATPRGSLQSAGLAFLAAAFLVG